MVDTFTTIKAEEDGSYGVNTDDLIPLVNNAGTTPKSVTPGQLLIPAIKVNEDTAYDVNADDLIPLVNNAGVVGKSVTPGQLAIKGDNTYIVGKRGYATIQLAVDAALAKPQFINELQLTGTADCTQGNNNIVGTPGGATEAFVSEILVYGKRYEFIAFSNDTTRFWYPIRDFISEGELYLELPFIGDTDTYNIYVAETNIHRITVLNDSNELVVVRPQTGVSGTDKTACLLFDFNDTIFDGALEIGEFSGAGITNGFVSLVNTKKRSSLAVEPVMLKNFAGAITPTAVVYELSDIDAMVAGVDVIFLGDSGRVTFNNVRLASASDGNIVRCSGTYIDTNGQYWCGWGDYDAIGGGGAINAPCNGDNSKALLKSGFYRMTAKATAFVGADLKYSFIKTITGVAGDNIVCRFEGGTFELSLESGHTHADDVTFCKFDSASAVDDGVDLYFENCAYLESGSQTIIPLSTWRLFTSDQVTTIKKKLHVINSIFPDWQSDWEHIEIVEFKQTDTKRTFSISAGILPADELDLLRATTHIIENVSGAVIVPPPVGTYPDGTIVKFIVTQDAIGGHTVTFSPADYVTGAYTNTGAANEQCSIEFTWNATRAKWVQSSADNQWL